MQRTARGCRAHRASRLAQVAAIGETAPGSQALHLHEAEGALIECRGGGRKVAHPGGVDQRGAVWQIEQARSGGGVPSTILRAHQCADTKFEFGRDRAGRITLIDEVLTPDSSRFWPTDRYAPGRPQPRQNLFEDAGRRRDVAALGLRYVEP